MKKLLAVLLPLVMILADASAATIFERGASWRWRPGTSEASTPVEAWRALAFNDTGFTTALAPFWYGDPLPGGTQITGMQNVYLCVFLRKTFVVTNVTEIGGMRMGSLVDDGFVAWINGTEVLRVNMPGAVGTAVTTNTLTNNQAVDPAVFGTNDLSGIPSSYLVPGTNVLTIQVFQSSLTSSDLGFDASLESVLTETTPPTVLGINPAAGTITNLTSVTVTFSEPVSGVAAAHLLINAIGATGLNAINSTTYTFSFVQPEYGNVTFTWSPSQTIADQALPPNSFNGTGPGATWSYNLVDNTTPTVAALTPGAGATVRSLPNIVVLFSEAVTGVDATDLLINNVPATGVSPVASREFTFTFPTLATGNVQVAWASGHSISDTASPANAFAGGNWTYRLDPNASDAQLYISEFMASNTRTNGTGSLIDEDRDTSDWIEIYNPSGLTVNLDGWYLTDSSGNLTKWRFPATNIAGGGFLIVFASGKDRSVPGARLHTSFTLSSSGEFLGLVKPDGSTIVSEYRPNYPQQVPNVSHGYSQAGSPPAYTTGTQPVYFTTATPGAVNLGGAAVPGPIIEDVTHTPNVPTENEDLFVTARVSPSFRMVSSVTMRYRIMFNAEVSTPMFDDGAHGDGLANDGLYGTIIPANLSTNGQMIRYLIAATDVNAGASRWPIFSSPTDTEEYLGTIVKPDYVTSKLPIFHLFVGGSPTNLPGIDTEAGGRLSFFYDGEFYDNVLMELRGNTSAGLNKKAHRLEFNRGHELRHAGPGPRTRKSTLLAEKLDPAYLRQHLCFWILDKLGVPTQFDYPVRLEMNGAFYQLAFHGDVLGQEQNERLGYDPKGALYKAIGNLVPGFASTGGFVKLEPDNDPSRTDYLALANGINETSPITTRRASVFDMLDVPQVINHLTGARWSSENDDVWANMCIYRDTYGDGLWRCIPFDMNASWGQLYGGSDPLEATVDTSKSHPLYGGASTGGNYNRLYDVIVTLPETRQMLLRRERSLMDMLVQPPGTPPDQLIIENYIKQMTNLIHAEALMDRVKWGNSDWAGNKSFIQGVSDLLNQFVGPRRAHWYATHSITNTLKAIGIGNANNAGIPLAQPSNLSLNVVGVEFNPSGGNQEQEFICVSNPAPIAVDITGWKLAGAVDFTFKPGTVIPSNSVLYVSPNVVQFRARTSGPRGGQGLFVVGPYKGQLSARGETIEVLNNLGALVHTNRYNGNPSLIQQHLRITEIMYHPSAHPANLDPEQFEYVELRNISTNVTISLAGVKFINGVEFNFTGSAVTSLTPGTRVLVVKNQTAFNARYGGGLPVAGQYTGNLDNGGERIQLLDAVNEEVLDFSYNNSWHPMTDGLGFSLVVVNENAEPDSWGSRTQWRISGAVEGAPGAADPLPGVVAPILVTEVLTHTDLPAVDQIELYNPTGDTVSLAGWWLTDDKFTPKKFLIPPGMSIPAGGYVMFSENDFNAAGSPTAFSLSSQGDEVYLYSGDGVNLTGYFHGYSYGAANTGVSFGRYINSQTNVFFTAQSATTLGAPNAGPKVGPIIISEINYRPVDLPGGVDNDVDEYIEISNISGVPVNLFDPVHATNTWRLRGGVDFDLPQGVTIPTGGFALFVNFHPTNTATATVFRSRFNIPPAVPLFGPYSGKLDNSGEAVRLYQPDTPELGEVPYVLIDEVDYGSTAPWSSAADGVGPTLQRIVATAFGNDPTNWTGVGPSPGAIYVAGGILPSIISQPANIIASSGRSATFNIIVSGSPPLFYQWRYNGQNIYGANGASFTIPAISPTNSGSYSCIIFNSAGSAESAAATLSVVFPPTITTHPADVKVFIRPDPASAPTTNAIFTAFATSTTLIRYQWLVNGVAIAGATNPSVTITNVQVNHYGQYRCAITDNVDTVLTTPATLYPMITPIITVHPTTQTVAVATMVGMSVAYTGFPPPFTNEWRRGSVAIGTNVTIIPSSIFTFQAAPVPTNYTYRAVVKNVASSGGKPSNLTPVITLADSDGDGIPDTVEVALGLNPNLGSDGAEDLDGDTMSNRAEYAAGTDPTNAASYLEIKQSTVPGLATVSVAAVANRAYVVEYTDDINGGTWQWLGDVVAQPADRVVQLTDSNWTVKRFYHVKLIGQP